MSPSAAIINLTAVMPQSGLKKAVLVAAGGGEARARRRGGQRSHGHMSPPLQPASGPSISSLSGDETVFVFIV